MPQSYAGSQEDGNAPLADLSKTACAECRSIDAARSRQWFVRSQRCRRLRSTRQSVQVFVNLIRNAKNTPATNPAGPTKR